MKSILVIGGSDSSSGAGIQADIKTISAFGLYATNIITAITAQNSLGVQKIFSLPRGQVETQIASIISDINFSCVKIGMLYNKNIINCVHHFLYNNSNSTPLVLDPIITATDGKQLLKKNALKELILKLFPLTSILTPNIPEAEIISGIKIKDVKDMKEAARIIYSLGPKNVLITGGHLKSKKINSVLFNKNGFNVFITSKIRNTFTHGTGCALASALAVGLVKNQNIIKNIRISQKFVLNGIKKSHKIGKGQNFLNHFTFS